VDWKYKFLKLAAVLILLVIAWMLFHSPISTQAEVSTPETAWNWQRSPSEVYTDTPAVTLKIYAQLGDVPKYVNWYGSDGEKVNCCKAGQLVRHYEYQSGVLRYVENYFYIKNNDREPGIYTVKVCNNYSCSSIAFETGFTIQTRTSHIYLPLVNR
jgi:hypothetical protein